MFSSKGKPTIGIDIGCHSIKLSQLKASAKGYQLLNFAIMPLGAKVFSEGSITNRAKIIEVIGNLIEMEQIKTKEVVTAISGPSVIIKRISLPKMTEAELAESIHWEAEQFIPFPIEEVNIDFQIIGEQTAGKAGDQMDVLLVAAKRDRVEEYSNLLFEAGLIPVVVEVNVFSIENSFEANYDIDPGKNIALIEIGAETISVNILKGGVTAFTRDINMGGNKFTESIQNAFNVDFDKAEQIKLDAGSSGIDKAALVRAMHQTANEIALEMQRTFEFFRSATADENIDRIVISGGCAKIKGLDKILSEKLSSPVEILNPFKKISFDSNSFDPEFLEENAPVAAVSVGLALRRAKDR